MEQLAPLLLFGRIGKGRAKRSPYFGPWDLVWHTLVPCVFGVGACISYEALCEVVCHVVNVKNLSELGVCVCVRAFQSVCVCVCVCVTAIK